MLNEIPAAGHAEAPSQQTRILVLADQAQEIRNAATDLETRLQSIVDRLDGPRPTAASGADKMVDAPGIMSTIQGFQGEARESLGRSFAWLDELERLV